MLLLLININPIHVAHIIDYQYDEVSLLFLLGSSGAATLAWGPKGKEGEEGGGIDWGGDTHTNTKQSFNRPDKNVTKRPIHTNNRYLPLSAKLKMLAI